MDEKFKALAGAMRSEIEAIPRAMLQDDAARGAVLSLLYQAVAQMGLTPVLYWKPPRSTREKIDLVGVDSGGEVPEVKIAFAVDPLVELAKVKAIEWVECPDKIVVTFSPRQDKVSQSTFFLTQTLEHINLFD